jgi:hypothetical protein
LGCARKRAYFHACTVSGIAARSLEHAKSGDLRLLLGQRIGLEYLVPKALELVAERPLQEADYYPGDLLSVLLRIDKAFWESHPTELHWLLSILRLAIERYGTILESCRNFLASHEQ